MLIHHIIAPEFQKEHLQHNKKNQAKKMMFLKLICSYYKTSFDFIHLFFQTGYAGAD